MENLVAIGQFWGGSFGFFGGLGVFFIGIGVLWWISLHWALTWPGGLTRSKGSVEVKPTPLAAAETV